MSRITSNGRSLLRGDEPFFYLADTAWEMLHRLDREATEFYLRRRAEQGYTVVQTVILAEEDGLRVPRAGGDLPLIAEDPSRPNEAYFAHVDWTLELAGELGLVLALVPTWGDKWNQKWGVGPEVFTPENALEYGKFLSVRYAGYDNIIWILGGDRPVESEKQRAVIEAMAAGLKAGGSRHLITFHPTGGEGSSQSFPEADWLDFHMWQSGHNRDAPNYSLIAEDYGREPVKPVLDGEPGYEDHKAGFEMANGYLDDYDCRKSLYWALFAGACGHTYGCHAIWQFFEPHRAPVNHPRRSWRAALDLPGGGQMGLARQLDDRFPFLGGAPAQELLVAVPAAPQHVGAVRSTVGGHVLFYFPSNTAVQIRMDCFVGATVKAYWFDPRSGQLGQGWSIAREPVLEFQPAGWGPDWVLILSPGDDGI